MELMIAHKKQAAKPVTTKGPLVESPGDELQLSPVDICYALQSSLTSAEARILLNKVSISKNFSPGILVLGNAEKLSLAFLNILMDTVTPIKHEGRLWVSAYQCNDRVRVVFKNHVTGTTPETADDAPGKSKPAAFGTGMINARQILDRHNVSVSENVVPGVGTTILLTFEGIHELKLTQAL
jgi:signal transduction histidine kinase